MFQSLYTRVMSWSKHPHAVRYLSAMSFAESSFFPIPPDVLLAPMCLSKPKKAMRYALYTTIASVLGGLLGYFIGSLAFEFIEPILHKMNYMEKYNTIELWFEEWGVWAIFVAGFSPIPYKLFTISAGVLQMALLPFVLASFIGRGARFFLVAGLIAWGGERLEETLRIHVERIGWGVTIALVIVLVVLNV